MVRVGARRGKLATDSAVKVIELAVGISRCVGKLKGGSATIRDLAAVSLDPALLRSKVDKLLALLKAQAIANTLATGSAHIIHAGRGHCADSGVNLGGADNKRATAAYAEAANTLSVNVRLGAEKVDGSAKGFGIKVRINTVAWFTTATAKERQIDSNCNKAALSQFGRVQVGALLLDGAERVADHHSRGLGAGAGVEGLALQEVASNGMSILIQKGDGLKRNSIALVEVIGMVREVLGDSRRRAHEERATKSEVA